MYKLSPAEFIRVMEVYHTCPLLLEALRQIRREKEIPKPEDPATFSAVFVAEPSIFVFPATISAFFVAGMPEGADGNRWQMGFGGRRPTEGGTRLAPLCGPFLIISHCER